MKRLVFALNVCLCLPHLALGQALQFEAQGGPQLTIRAKAQEQQWLVVGGKVLVAAVAEGRLVVQEFAWPPEPGPGPGPDPGPSPDPNPGPEPKPDPQPEPQPPKPARWQVAFFVESDALDNLSPDQKTLLASLLLRKDLEARGHRLVGVLDPDTANTATDPALQAWFSAAKGKAPCMAIAPMEGGTIRVYPLPADKDALWKLLENPPAQAVEGGGQKPSRARQEAATGTPRCLGGRCVR